MSLLGRLTEKSWLTPGVDAGIDPSDYRPPAVQVMLYVYCAVAAMIFALIVMAYLMRMEMHVAMGHASGDWRPMPEPALLWVNTGVLLLASVAWEWARRAAVAPDGQNSAETMRRGMLAGGLLGIAFLGGQLLLWRQFDAAGYYLSANPANAFFYLLTATHGLHLIGGVIGWLRVLNHSTPLGVRLCALYWHYLLLIWVLLAGLLFLT
ncbi:cytochrome c oxidase subunit 3 [Sphingobium sp. H39-3-25]|uniref:cytochrome c oxidase subunit 3 n=1 Tax=Sphingobium arseniciresistens TaxID=3030834 RepID=UPI0023B8E143|nr:cytochrome c oxidase subunit 3 [Sphingobium arseniciresistens]